MKCNLFVTVYHISHIILDVSDIKNKLYRHNIMKKSNNKGGTYLAQCCPWVLSGGGGGAVVRFCAGGIDRRVLSYID